MKNFLPLELNPATSATVLAEKIRIRQARELVRQMPLTIAGNFLLALLSLVIFQKYLSPVYIFGWLALFLVTSIPGLRQWIKYSGKPAPDTVSVKLIWRASLYSSVVALPWAIGNWFAFDLASHEDELFLIFVTGGLTAGAISLLAAIPLVSLAYVAMVSAPVILQVFMTGGALHTVMGSMLIIYVTMLTVFARASYRSMKDGLALEIERQKMISQLQEAHHRLSRTLERASEEILLFDRNECLVMSNAAKTGSLLFPANELKEGVGLVQLAAITAQSGLLAAPDGDAAWRKAFLDWYRNPEHEFKVNTTDGRICGLAVQPTTDGEKFLVVTDISALSAQAAIARASTQRLLDFAETAADWMWEIDEKAKFKLLAPHKAASTSLDGVLSRKITDWPSTMPIEAERKLLAETLAGRRAFRDLRFQFAQDGESWTLSLSGKPIFNENGEYRGHRGTFRDVTKDVLAAQQLVEAKERAEIASRTKSEFLAHMSHELRTPLNAILGFSEIMSMELYGKIEQPKYVDYVQTIHDSGAHLLAIINDILDISRIESGKMELHERSIDIAGLFESCLQLISARATEAGHVIDAQLPQDMPHLWADERNAKQILINLISNAVKFTPYGGRIQIGAELAAQDCIRFWVRDNGPGLSAEDQVRVLIPFDRGSAMTKEAVQGCGLGLPLCKMLVELHGGRLSLESKLGQGLTVSALFPPERTERQKLSVHA